MPIEVPLCLRRMTVELRHLRCFLAIAEERNLTRAAQRLRLTQPAVSRTLRQLERHLGVRLVDRSTHHVALTPQGAAFRQRAAAALDAVEHALDPARVGTSPLRVGHAWAALGPHTATLLRRWERDHPAMPLALLRIDERTAGLADGKVDAALLRAAVSAGGLVCEPVLTERRVAAVPAGSGLAARAALTMADFAGETVAVNPVSGVTTLDLWPSRTRPRSALEVANTDDWLAAIAAGRAVGLTTSATPSVHTYPGVTFVPVTDAPPIRVVLAWRRDRPHPAVPALLALTREVVAAR